MYSNIKTFLIEITFHLFCWCIQHRITVVFLNILTILFLFEKIFSFVFIYFWNLILSLPVHPWYSVINHIFIEMRHFIFDFSHFFISSTGFYIFFMFVFLISFSCSLLKILVFYLFIMNVIMNFIQQHWLMYKKKKKKNPLESEEEIRRKIRGARERSAAHLPAFS